jgi:hypothetical protein
MRSRILTVRLRSRRGKKHSLSIAMGGRMYGPDEEERATRPLASVPMTTRVPTPSAIKASPLFFEQMVLDLLELSCSC